jgi:hypothetical protein
VIRNIALAVSVATAAAVLTLAGVSAAFAEKDFPFTGTYTQNVPCKGDGSDPPALKVKISPKEIVSNIGVCTILDTTHKAKSVTVHVECKFPAGPLIGDITFTPRPDNTIKFVDRDNTYNAILHRCPD